jgi:hypothetical protein
MINNAQTGGRRKKVRIRNTVDLYQGLSESGEYADRGRADNWEASELSTDGWGREFSAIAFPELHHLSTNAPYSASSSRLPE